jgi:hypothetical protein
MTRKLAPSKIFNKHTSFINTRTRTIRKEILLIIPCYEKLNLKEKNHVLVILLIYSRQLLCTLCNSIIKLTMICKKIESINLERKIFVKKN